MSNFSIKLHTNPNFLKYHLFCKICSRPFICLECQNVMNIEKAGFTCKFCINIFYYSLIKKHAQRFQQMSCTFLVHYKISIIGRLACDSSERIEI
ncbi:unnamed protein product [Paramecium pentaurelia]|uniref:Uncharacterized protein n=1 Tax=Paramecium pentaurelia TaxID=43138 RepID=A0A8S1YJR6_9CILI|nr:unnamed protein product [Paramecium pentaurelia]